MRSIAPALLCVSTLIIGCNPRDIGPIDPHVSRFFHVDVGNDGVGDVDLLFVIDDSGSMAEEQASLEREIPRLIEGLTNPPLDAEGNPEWNAVQSLHVAVVTTNLGTRGVPVSSARVGAACAASGGRGDDGALRVTPACGPNAVLRWREGDDPAAFAAQVGCLTDAGTSGCGLEQPLAAAVLALDQPPGTTPFPRPEALLAVVVLSDEEDCSLGDAAGFFAGSETGRELNQRCVREPNLLEPIDGLVAGLLAGRDPESFLFAALVGLPEDLQEASLETMLADERMQYRLTSDNALGLVPACESFDSTTGESRGQAAPGRRYVELAQRFEGSLVRSICAESFQPAIAELTRRLGGRVSGVCATRSLTPDAEGAVACEVRETLPEGARCLDLPARSFLELSPEGREVCLVQQAVGTATVGWRYDADGSCEQVLYTEDAVPPFGTRVDLECLVDVEVPAPGSPTG